MKKITLSAGAFAGSLATNKILVDFYKKSFEIAEGANHVISNFNEVNTLSAIVNNSGIIAGSLTAYFVADKVLDCFFESSFMLPSTNKMLKDVTKSLLFIPLSTGIHECMHAAAAYATGTEVVAIQPFMGGSLDRMTNPHISVNIPEGLNDISEFIIASAGIFGASALTLGIAELVERTNASKSVKFATRGFATLTSILNAGNSLLSSDEMRYNSALAKLLFPALSHETGEMISHIITSALASACVLYNVYKIKKNIDNEHKIAAEELGIDVKEYKTIEKNKQEDLFNALYSNSDVDKSQTGILKNKLSMISLPKFFDGLECYMSDEYLLKKPCKKLAGSIKVPKELVHEAADAYISLYKEILEIESEKEYQEKRHELRMHIIYEYLPLFKMMKGKKSMSYIPNPDLVSVIEAANQVKI